MNANEKRLLDQGVKRVCLKCRRLFASTGSANRICGECAGRNERLNQPTRCETQGQSLNTDERRVQHGEQEAPTAQEPSE